MQASTFTRPRGPRTKRNARASIWMLLIAEFMLFFGLLSSFFFLRGTMSSWGPPTGRSYDLLVPLFNTVLLLGSSVTMHLAYRAIRRDQKRTFETMLLLTALLGTGFIAAQVYEFSVIGFAFQDGAYAAIFMLTLGTHAAHVAIGVLIFAVVQVQASFGLLNARRYLAVELCAIYWYFVALMWIVIFGILYFF